MKNRLRGLLFLLVVADGIVCGILSHLFFSTMLPSVEVVLADSAPPVAPLSAALATLSGVPVRKVSSFELVSRTETVPVVSNGESFALIEASPTPSPPPAGLPAQAGGPSPTGEPVIELASTGGSDVLALTAGGLPQSTAILPPCAAGEEFKVTGFYTIHHTSDDRREDKFHPGVDGKCWVNRTVGWDWTAVAVADAVVRRSLPNLETDDPLSGELFSSGRTVVLAFIFQGEEYEAVYGHLEFPFEGDFWPQEGDRLNSGDPVGRIGQTGAASGRHLHLGLRRKGPDGNFTFVNPEDFGILGRRP